MMVRDLDGTMKPLIGISCCVKAFGVFNTPNHAASDSYVRAVLGPVDGIPVLLEDGFKFGGICAWAAYHAAAACRLLREGAVGGAGHFGGPPSPKPF